MPPRLSPAAWAMCVLTALFATAWAPAPALAAAERPIFVWLDGAGALHATDKLSQVPEPFYSSYRRRLAEADRGAAPAAAAPQAGAAEEAPPSGPRRAPAFEGAASAQTDARAEWKKRALQAHNALLEKTLALQAAEKLLGEANHNPILRLLPQPKAKANLAKEKVEALRAEALEARKQALVELPAQARAAGVPPQWIMP